VKISRLRPFTICLLISATGYSQLLGQHQPQFDLSAIGATYDGRQICEDTGRLQDWPSKVMDQIISAGPKSVPILIGMLADERVAKTEEPIICFWGQMTIGDLAFCVLSDLFTNRRGKTTLQGASWDEILGPPGDLPAWEQLHRFARMHGRKGLQAKWQTLWDKYGGQLVWDPNEKCFKVMK